VIEATSNVTEEEFAKDKILQDAILRRVEVLGESSKRVSDEFKEKYPEIPWREIAGTRDVIVHNYDGVDMHEVWLIATRDIPKLLPHLEKMLSEVTAQEAA
jgi:uncharacterized protein with HEPN domain